MSESLERIENEIERLHLRDSESQLLHEYYSFLLGEEPSIERKSLLQFANGARKIVSMWTDLDDETRSKVPQDSINPICRAARVMYFVAELMKQISDRAHWFRESSIAYLQSGNIPASTEAWQRYQKSNDIRNASDWMVESILGYSIENGIVSPSAIPVCVKRPWLSADLEYREQSRQELYRLSCSMELSEVFEKSLCYRVGATLPLFGQLSLAGLVDDCGIEFPEWYLEKLVEDRRVLLLPSQVPAIKRWFESSNNFVLCTPTSTGKTFVAELAMVVDCCRNGGVSIFATPYRAVARTIWNTLKVRLAGSDISVVAAFGDETDVIPIGKGIIVGTPEKIDGLLIRHPEILTRTQVFVVDEIHMISQKKRGPFLESLVSRLLLSQSLGEGPKRIFAISAVVENHEQLGRWMDTNVVVTSKWRPNPIVEAYWSKRDDLLVIDRTNDDSNLQYWEFKVDSTEFPPWPSGNIPSVAVENQVRKPLGHRCSWYAKTWRQNSGGPVLVICSSRAQTREFAFISIDYFEEMEDLQIQKVADKIDEDYPYLTLLTYCLRRGVAYHNAALPSLVRHQVEDLISSNLLNVVFATTTLAEGADFPFRSVVIAAPAHFDPDTTSYSAMSPLLLRNIAGRGGRTAGQLVGDVVQFYSPHLMKNQSGDSIVSQDVFREHLLDSENCQISSALEADLGNSEISSLYSAFDRVINRWDNREQAISEYRQNFYAETVRASQGEFWEHRYENLMRDPGVFGEPLALRASPLHLTQLGEVVMNSECSVESAKTIWKRLEELQWFEDIPSQEQIVEECTILGGVIPEITELRGNTRRPLKEQNISRVFTSLSTGGSISEAYLIAEESASNAIQRKASKLVEGEAGYTDSVHARFEHFADELKRKLLQEVPKIANAMRLFIEYKGLAESTENFEQLIQMTKEIRKVID